MRSMECSGQDLRELRQMFQQTCSEIDEMLTKLTRGREKIQEELTALQKENNNLVGKYTIHSQELQSEAINLPDTVQELHELVLKQHQDLIIAKIGKEAAEEKINTLQLLLRDQITNDQHQKELIENNVAKEIDMLKKQKHQLEKENKLYLANQEKLQNSHKANLAQIVELHKKQLHDMQTTITASVSRCALQMSRLSILNSPSVQSPKPSTSKAITPPQPLVDDNTLRSNTRGRLHIELISMQEIQEAVADDSILEPEEDTVQEPPIVLRDGLSTIVNESSNSRVDETEDSFSTALSSDPSFYSTPLKLETMQSLDLVPTTECSFTGSSIFVNDRKRGGSSRVISPKKDKSASPMKHKRLPYIVIDSTQNKENIRSETKPRKTKSKEASSLVKRSSPGLRDSEKKTSPEVRQRSMRNGKPKTLKEPTLRSKLRRE